MVNLKKLNNFALKRFRDYQSLNIYGTKVITPYFVNSVEGFFARMMKKAEIPPEQVAKVRKLYKNKMVPYGWYRGKGTPEEIAAATIAISESSGLSLKSSSPEAIREFMKIVGLGIDCSGLVYHLISHAFLKVGEPDLLNKTLDWANPEKTSVYQARSATFAGRASISVKPQDLQPLDLAFIKKKEAGQGYSHVALILENKKEGGLVVVQSTLIVLPTGTHLSPLKIERNEPKFGFKRTLGSSWESLFSANRLEFRRLKPLMPPLAG